MPQKKKVLITGVTGFIGSHIAECLLQSGFQVIGLVRKNSDRWRCKDFANEISWTVINRNLKQAILKIRPDIIIHCAWEGAEAAKREDAVMQGNNLLFLKKMLELATLAKVKQFIAMGSQAEYGYLSRAVSEEAPLQPLTAYGKAKLEALQLLRSHAAAHKIKWYWLRLFSFYGPKEAKNWFIPHVISSLLENKASLSLSACTQQYAYLYVKDLAACVSLLTGKANAAPGVYNISGSRAYPLTEVVRQISGRIQGQSTKIIFGGKPLPAGQSLLLKGKMKKFHTEIGRVKTTSLAKGLAATIQYYKSNLHESV